MPSEPLKHPPQLRAMLFLPAILVFPTRAPEFVYPYQFFAPEGERLPIRAFDLRSVLHPLVLRVDGVLSAEGEVCRGPRSSRSRPAWS